MSLLYQDIGVFTNVQFCPVSNRDWECARDRGRESERGGSGSASRNKIRLWGRSFAFEDDFPVCDDAFIYGDGDSELVVREKRDISVSHLCKWALGVVERCVLSATPSQPKGTNRIII
jgi:hypothetical protein